MSPSLPSPIGPSKSSRILKDSNERGIRASSSRWSWRGKSIKYKDSKGETCFLNRTSALKYLESHKTEAPLKNIRISKLKDSEIKQKIADINQVLIAKHAKESDQKIIETFKLSEDFIELRDHAENLQDPAQLFKLGENFDKLWNRTEAMKHYKLAADLGHAGAQKEMGIIYFKGVGVKENHEEAFKYFKLAADQGNTVAERNLGIMYEQGKGVDPDIKLAVKYYKLAAKKGDPVAQYNLGLLYEEGKGVHQSDKLAFENIEKAAKQGYAEALCHLGALYEEKNEFKLAAKCYQFAVDRGHEGAKRNLGLLYLEGKGVDQNYEKAIENLKWFAMKGGDPDIQFIFGAMFEEGRGFKHRLKYSFPILSFSSRSRI